jgi:ankyrin repeat protein
MFNGKPRTAVALAVALVVIMLPVVSCASTSDFEFLAAAREGDVNKVESMLADGANVNSTDEEGNNAAFYAMSGENFPMLKVLVEHRINIEARNKDGDTILHIAARKDSLDIVNLLIENKANLRAKEGI